MTKNRRTIVKGIGLLAITATILMLLFATGPFLTPSLAPTANVESQVVQQFLYAMLTREEMIKRADAIFMGKVIDISSTLWNQNNGEYWEDENGNDEFSPLQLHYVQMEVTRPIVGNIVAGERITITVLGRSPLDGISDHALRLGKQAVVFLSQTEIIWRDGKRAIWGFTNAPDISADIESKDGLYYSPQNQALLTFDELLQEVSEKRR